MRVNTKIVIDIATNKVLERESLEYVGPIARCCGGGGGGGDAGMTGSVGGSLSGMGDLGIGTGGMAGPPGGSAPGSGGEGEGSPQVSFSSSGMQVGMSLGSALGIPGMAIGGLIGGVIGSAMEGSGVPGGMDMSGDPTGGNAVGGPDATKPAIKKPQAPKVKETEKPKETGTSLDDVTKDAEKETRDRARRRPSTILTSPLGLRSRPSIRRATLLGG